MTDAKERIYIVPSDFIAGELYDARHTVEDVISRLSNPVDYRIWNHVEPTTRKSTRITKREDAADFEDMRAIVKHPLVILDEVYEKVHHRQEFKEFAAYLHKQTEVVDAELKAAAVNTFKLPSSVRNRRWDDMVTCVYAIHLALKRACEACGCKQAHESPV